MNYRIRQNEYGQYNLQELCKCHWGESEWVLVKQYKTYGHAFRAYYKLVNDKANQ